MATPSERPRAATTLDRLWSPVCFSDKAACQHKEERSPPRWPARSQANEAPRLTLVSLSYSLRSHPKETWQKHVKICICKSIHCAGIYNRGEKSRGQLKYPGTVSSSAFWCTSPQWPKQSLKITVMNTRQQYGNSSVIRVSNDDSVRSTHNRTHIKTMAAKH